ncbi:haloacid dehalogenase superfamily, subfamily IA, variant 3 with third motif having DD or ED/haloacid dehalogenase superfamily, subfamily IA, variant 1 with third motif having Dx(3-4)D or Dx(3-4)E [bacterium A37T11]|nr:haloacid dehalogenase superfamily, subfamily IA, variant 3 with third motif having DD or ED/haloacid dehalogenase superfamily, subfamily IA, variant 1 with third motif having Dx(3-4)D or Dx(3-4)E [bacterium A37T11]
MNESDTLKLATLNQLSEGNYDAFLYDCDGTLADNMPAHKAAYVVAAANHGLELDPAIIDELAGWPTVLIAKEINKRYHTSLDPAAFANEKSTIFIDQFMEKTQRIDFVVEHLLMHLQDKKIGVVSGGSRKTVTKTLATIGLNPYIKVLVCAGETERGKPFADPFLEAARQLGVEPSRCLVFEDGDPGTQAAEAAGMDWIRIDKLVKHFTME